MKQTQSVLLIGGLDPTGHAGLMRDAAVCAELGTPCFLYVTALTAQSDQEYLGTQVSSSKYLVDAERSLPEEEIGVVKIGMLGSVAVVRRVVMILHRLMKKNSRTKIVWDPVFYSSSGGTLLSPQGQRLAQRQILPLCDLVTPNALEMRILLGLGRKTPDHPQKWCRKWGDSGNCALYLKGGHLRELSCDYLVIGKNVQILRGPVSPKKIRGTGCALATAISCYLSQGQSISASCAHAKKYIQKLFQFG